MKSWIELGRGPLFRLAFSLMVLGLLRIFALTLIGVGETWQRSPDKIVPWKQVARQTLAWLVPFGRLWRKRPVYSTVSFLFHTGLLVVPLFLAAHVALWKRGLGFAWPAIPQTLASWLSILVVLTGVGLFLGRLAHPAGRALGRFQDYLWPLLLVTPFATGYICSNTAIRPKTYELMMLVHVYSANLVMLAIPFTKIAHCVLAPLSQLVTALAWKFPAGAGDKVAATLGHPDRPVWKENARA